MTLSEERLKILKMVREGKITAEDASELLAALDEASGKKSTVPSSSQASQYSGDRKNRWLRVRVTDTRSGRTRVNVRLPVSMVNAGVKMGMRFTPEIEGMQIDKLMELIDNGELGQIVDVYDDEDGEHVEVYIE